MVNFSPLAAEMCSLVWGTPANFNRFCILAVLLHGTVVVGVNQTAALNRGRYLYLAGQPSRRALAHILVMATIWFSSIFLLLFFRSSPTDDLVDWNSGVSVRPSVRPYVHKKFFRFPSNLVCG